MSARGTLEYRIRQGAVALGIAPETYRAHVEDGDKWCIGCKTWHPVSAFGYRANRPDGLNQECRAANNTRSREGMRRLYWRRRREAAQ